MVMSPPGLPGAAFGPAMNLSSDMDTSRTELDIAVMPSVSALGFLCGQLPAARQFGFGRLFRSK